MLIKFTVSAPGKVILNGEHSVVYNHPAVAGVIGLRNYITFTENNDSCIHINLDIFPNVQINIPLTLVTNLLVKIHSEFNAFKTFLNVLESNHDIILDMVNESVKQIESMWTKNLANVDREHIEKTLSAILYLLVASAVDEASSADFLRELPGFTLDFKSNITIGSGLGSSASFAVCLAATFCTFLRVRTNATFVRDFNEASKEEQTFFKNTISNWAFCSERIMHGTPSGLDNTISTFGNVVQFTKNPQKIIDVNLRTKLNIMLVNSGVSRNTLKIVQQVKELRDQHKQIIDTIMNAMGALVNDVVRILENQSEDTEIKSYEQLKRLFLINNSLLRAIGVSHPILEKIFVISERNGFGCKLTGAGAGGYAIILLPPSYKELDDFHQLCEELKAGNFSFDVTTIGGSGLEINTLE